MADSKQRPLSNMPAYTVMVNGKDTPVNEIIQVDEVPDDAPVLMEAGGGALRMYAATEITSLPFDLMFPVYVESEDMASLVPIESAMRHAQWVVPDDSILNDSAFINGIKKTKSQG